VVGRFKIVIARGDARGDSREIHNHDISCNFYNRVVLETLLIYLE
jgi:hypothetical protein